METLEGINKKRERTKATRFVTLCGKCLLTKEKCKFSQKEQEQRRGHVRLVAERETENGKRMEDQGTKNDARPTNRFFRLQQKFEKAIDRYNRNDENG